MSVTVFYAFEGQAAKLKLRASRRMSYAFIDLLAEILGTISKSGITRADIAGIVDLKVTEMRKSLQPDDVEGRMEIEELEAIAERLRKPADAVVSLNRDPLN